MPVTLPSPPDTAPLPPNRIRWTRDQCRAMQDAGILIGRYELVQGEILLKMGQKPAHAYVIRMLTAWLIGVFGALHVQTQLPIHIVGDDAEYNEPEPDCAVLVHPAQEFADHHPTPPELHMVLEVSDTSLGFDLAAKGILYGRAGIPEYWLIDVVGRRLLVFRNPGASGYGSIVAYSETERPAPLASPGNSLAVADLFPSV